MQMMPSQKKRQWISLNKHKGHNRNHIEIYVFSMFLCFYPEQSGQVVV